MGWGDPLAHLTAAQQRAARAEAQRLRPAGWRDDAGGFPVRLWTAAPAAWVAARAGATPQAVRRWRADPAYRAAAAALRRAADEAQERWCDDAAQRRPCARPDCHLRHRPAVLRLDRCGADDCPRRAPVPFRFTFA